MKWASLSSLSSRLSEFESSLLLRMELLLNCAQRASSEDIGGKEGGVCEL